MLSDLAERGYAIVRDEVYEGRGSRFIELRRRRFPRRIQVVCDRGLWEVGVQVGMAEHGPDQVLLALAGAPYQTRAMSHAECRVATCQVVDELTGRPFRVQRVKRELRRLTREYNEQLGSDEPLAGKF